MASGYSDRKEMFEGDVSVGSLDCLLTPCGGSGRETAEARRLDFSGFQGEGQIQGEKMIHRRMYMNRNEKNQHQGKMFYTAKYAIWSGT